jgi:CO/xanthine dehydrogenase FAD-binding subunit
MPISHEFEYAKPSSIEEAIGLLEERGAAARVLAGGTDVVSELRDGLVTPDLIVDLKGIDELDAIAIEGGLLSIGPLVTFTDLIESSAIRSGLPLLWEAAKTVGSVAIRNRATMTGNICSAVPCCDAGAPLLVYEAAVRVDGPNGARSIPIAEWFVGPRETALGSAELVTAITVPRTEQSHGGAYVKLGRSRGEDLAQASAAIAAFAGNRYRVAFGAVAPTPVRAGAVEALLAGRQLTDALIEEAKELVRDETSPITDVRASREYREHMLPIMFERGVRAAAERLAGGGPAYGTRLV